MYDKYRYIFGLFVYDTYDYEYGTPVEKKTSI